MENISYSEKKTGWLAGEEISTIEELLEEDIEYSNSDDLVESCTSLIYNSSYLYAKTKNKDLSDAIIQLEGAKRSLILTQ